MLIRPRLPFVKGEPKEYDIKPLFTGNKRGWVVLDLTTANAMNTVYNALSEENQRKWDNIHVVRLVEFTWEHVH